MEAMEEGSTGRNGITHCKYCNDTSWITWTSKEGTLHRLVCPHCICPKQENVSPGKHERGSKKSRGRS